MTTKSSKKLTGSVRSILLAATIVGGCALISQAAQNTPAMEEQTLQVVKKYLPGTSALGPLRVNKVSINDAAKIIQVDLNETGGSIPFTAASLADLKNDIRTGLGKKYEKYDVNVDIVLYNKGQEVKRTPLDKLVLFANKKYVTPSETNRFITPLNRQAAPKGLDGSNIAMWQSHGWYFEPKLNRWEWQRARILQTVEDLYTQSYVIPFLMPMLENAGAYVMSPRERDVNITEIIVDNDGGYAKGKYTDGGWQSAPNPGFAYTDTILTVNVNPFVKGTAKMTKASSPGQKKSSATWNAEIPKAGEYAVYVSYQTLPESATDALYSVNALDGKHDFKINQKMGGSTWIYLGHFPFAEGTQSTPIVELSSESSNPNAIITADAVKIGGGMGNVARKVGEPKEKIDYEYVSSGYPRFTEAAMYWLQWAGAPDSVYTPSKNINDYTDDYRSRGEWVNWLAGGSSVLPDRKGLNIPIDLSFAFHTDAGTTMNDSIIGTLGIYCTDGHQYGDNYVNGMSRYASRDLTDLIMSNIVNDVRATFEPNWTRRGMRDASYYEARVPEVPAMLLEFLSHQNLADMKYGLDPAFRFLVSRGIYKGMLQFIAQRDGRDYVVQPLPINSFSITGGNGGKYTLRWKETVDKLEKTATPKYYIIQERIGDGGFRQIAKVEKLEYNVTISDNNIHSYRIIAANDGGTSFPSEVLALRYLPDAPQVNIVNGFTRVSAPDWFEAGEIAGFADEKDHGVPYVQDISYIGSMYEFRREIPWMDDDAPGFGASRANYEDKVIAGNTFDFVYTHGKAIADAGYGFVSSSVAAFTNSPVSNEPKLVDLILGKQKEIARGRGAYGTDSKTFPIDLQKKITEFTAAGGSMFVSGAYVASDLWDNRFSSEETAKADQAFATGVLGYHWRTGQACLKGEAYEVQTRFPQFNGGTFDFYSQLNSESYAAESPDSFYPADDKKGSTFMRYKENNLVAGIAHNAGKYRTVVIGFPFETITSVDQRSRLMTQILNFLTDKSAHSKMAEQVTPRDNTDSKRGKVELTQKGNRTIGRAGANAGTQRTPNTQMARTVDANPAEKQVQPTNNTNGLPMPK